MFSIRKLFFYLKMYVKKGATPVILFYVTPIILTFL